MTTPRSREYLVSRDRHASFDGRANIPPQSLQGTIDTKEGNGSDAPERMCGDRS